MALTDYFCNFIIKEGDRERNHMAADTYVFLYPEKEPGCTQRHQYKIHAWYEPHLAVYVPDCCYYYDRALVYTSLTDNILLNKGL